MKIIMLDTVEDSHSFYVQDSKSKRQIQVPHVGKFAKGQIYDNNAFNHMKFKHDVLSDADIVKGLQDSWPRRCKKLIDLKLAAEHIEDPTAED